ncbi:MAG: tRNA dimethylallyltransferase, partial [Candidatus Auribacterota bacterium]|nr:tRNA dimethylallyltransferase [Candidatus Auribacterota bacterium]
EKLKEVDALAAEKIHPNNVRRVIRALEFFYATGKKFSSETCKWEVFDSKRIAGREYRIFGLLMERNELYKRINCRVDKMIQKGLVEEAEKVLKNKEFKHSTASQAIGYKEFINMQEHEITLEKAIENLKKNTRNFAKRQLTWFRKDKRIEWIEVDEESKPGEIVRSILGKLGESEE